MNHSMFSKNTTLKTHFIGLLLCLLASACTSAQFKTNIKNVWISEAPPMAKVNGGYFEIENLSQEAIKLVSVSGQDFSRIEMHRSFVEQDMARMEKQESVEIPAGSKLVFKPGDYHLMLFDAKRPLKAGDRTTLTFYLSDESIIETTANVRPLGTQTEHKHHNM